MREPGGLPRLGAGDVLAGRYLVADLLDESRGGRFWRAEDQVLQRHVAIHVIPDDDERADGLLEAARLSATVHDRRILRVLDADRADGLCFVVNEWGAGASLDIMLARDGPIAPRRAAWLVSEAAAVAAAAHDAGVAHGRLAPENVLVDHHGAVRIIGLAVEAALWGLPPGRMSTDVTDLGALLYAALTSRWAGVSRSSVRPAHQVGGRVLRPRKVRAGIPRVLDDLCDEVLNSATVGAHGRSAYDLTTARGVADALTEFVGDPTGLAVPEPDTSVSTLVSLPPLEEPRAPDAAPPPPDAPLDEGLDEGPDSPGGGTPPVPEPGTEVEPPPPPDDGDGHDHTGTGQVAYASTDQPTQAGMPVFDDERDEVAWISARAEKPPPPPPFEETPERPLFAPDPPDGGPVRTPRDGVVPTPADGFWPWEGTGPTGGQAGGGQSGVHGGRALTSTHPGMTSTGSGIGIAADEDDDDEVPGRSWLRLAAVVGACMLLLLAVVFSFNLGQGRSPLQFDDEPDETADPTSSASPAAQVVAGTTATDLDPQGSPPEENPDLAPLVVDGNPTTSWRTSTYTQQIGPAGLKTGVGLVVDLGQVRDVRRVRVDLVGEPTGVTLFVTPDLPSGVAELEPAATVPAGERLDEAIDASGRYVVVWLTSLPEVDGGFRGEIAEVVVRA